MRLRELPATQELRRILEQREDPNAEARYMDLRSAWIRELFACKGFQIMLELLQQLEHEALKGLRHSPSPDLAQNLLGRMAAFQSLRNGLAALLPDEPTIPEPEEEFDLPVYQEPFPSGFDIPYPSGE